ncbi:hypothetical protein Tco_1325963, partial [Tanacetum coccineum]
SELGSELTFLCRKRVGSSELQELCPFNFLPASCQVSSSELHPASYRAASKENGVNILNSIDEGPFQMGTFRETLVEGTEGALHLGLPKDIYSLINHYTDAKDIWDNVKMLLEGAAGYGGAHNRFGNANPGQARQVKCYNYNGGQDNTIDEDVDEQPVQDLALNVDNVF